MFEQGVIISAATILMSFIVIGYISFRFVKNGFSPFSNYCSDLLPHDNLFIPKAIIYSLFIAGATTTFFIFFSSFNSVIGMIAAIALALSALLALPLPYLKPGKPMVYYSIIYFALSGMASILAASAGIFETQIAGSYKYPLWLAIVLALIGLAQICLLFVPSLWNPVFSEKAEEDGKVVYVRPRFCTLALYQWIYPLLSILEILLILFASIFLSI